ncbi:MAG: GH12 family glycosyl hydrolase domain-containing protein, partial [Rhodoglobus sp.]
MMKKLTRAMMVFALTAALGAGGALAGGQSALAQTTLCGTFETVRVDGGRYIVQNNRWGASSAQCIEAHDKGFTVVQAEHNTTNGKPAAYPSIFTGCHYTLCTVDSGLPLKVSEFGNVRASYEVDTVSSGVWNASLDLWFDPTKRTNGRNT